MTNTEKYYVQIRYDGKFGIIDRHHRPSELCLGLIDSRKSADKIVAALNKQERDARFESEMSRAYSEIDFTRHGDTPDELRRWTSTLQQPDKPQPQTWLDRILNRTSPEGGL